MPKLSVIVPVFRESEGLRRNFLALAAALDSHPGEFSYELLFVNDGSPDNSLEILEAIHSEYPTVTGVVNLSRNFGQVAAIFAGLRVCTGDCAAVISADLQDPPDLIPKMFERWREGYKTVLAIRRNREDSVAASLSSRVFYGLMRAYALPNLPATGFDFFLADRAVIDRMLIRPEPNGFLQGQLLSASGAVFEIPYTRGERKFGRSGWPFGKKVKYFLDGFVAYSFTPIRLIALLGLFLFLLGIAASIGLVIQRIWFGTHSAGWSSIMIAMMLLHGTEMLMIAVVGEYLWRTLEQARDRPLYIVDYQKLPESQARAAN
jgi:polyisoprenyl-phosphate glycosyltransferase